MKKKVLSVITSVAVLGSLACASAVSSSAFSGEIKFEVTDNLAKANKTFYAHIWNGLPGGASLYQWQTKEEKMTWKSGDATASYNVPDGDWNLIIISGNSGFQTYDCVFNSSCIGDTCYVMDESFENPVDSKKSTKGLGWRNATGCGPHKVISSLGKVIGTDFLPGETDQNLYDNFVEKYNPENGTNGKYDGINYMDWSVDGQAETGKDWETIKKEVAQALGVQVSSSEQEATEAATSAPAATEAATSTGSSGTGSSGTGSSGTGSSSSSSGTSTTGTSTTTTTGDTTPVVGLFATLVSALGVVFLARKKATK